MAKFVKKPIAIEAVQWTGSNVEDISAFIGKDEHPLAWAHKGDYLDIFTLEGTMSASPNDWIIRGVKGEYYPCKPDIFEQSYDAIPADPITA